jgi:asparagine synthase (glutamine-hydrolysing)
MLQKPFFPFIHDPFARVGLFASEIVKPAQGYDYLCEIYKHDMENCPILDIDSDVMKRSRQATWLSVSYFMTSLLERKDRMSMASGLEVRVPFADHRILEYVYNIPWEIKFENSIEKALLRNSMAEFLPEKILNRKKSPYPKTHNPDYERLVRQLLAKRMLAKKSVLNELIDPKKLKGFLDSESTTWFGQLMSKPQLIAWLIQLDFWFEKYEVAFVE